MLKNIDNTIYIKFLLLSFPLLLITGPLLPEIALGLILILLVYKLFLKDIKVFYDNFLLGYLIFYIIIVIGSILSDHVIYSLKSTFFYFRFFFLIMATYYILSLSKNFLPIFKNVLLIIFLILIADGYYQYFFKENIIGLSNYNKYRVSSFFGKELIYGSYLARFFPFLIGLLILHHKSRMDKVVIYLIIFLSISAIFISGERTALMLSIMSLVIIIFLTNFFLKTKIYIFLVFIPLLTVLIYNNDYIKNKWHSTIFDTIISSFNKKITYNDKEYNLILNEKYTAMTITAYKMFQDKPLVGHGVKTFRIKCKEDPYKLEIFDYFKTNGINKRLNCSTHPHNTYIQLLSETGFLGFIFVFSYFISITYSLIVAFFKRKKNNLKNIFDFRVCVLSCIFINLFPLTTTGSFFNNWLSMVYFFPIGFLLFLNKNYKL